MPKWIQDPITRKLIPAQEYRAAKENLHYVHGDLESFVSPIDGSVISDRGHLRAHNKKHGVTNPRDYGQDYFEKKAYERQDALKGTSKKARAERIEDIQRAFYDNTGK
jgi:hypothetical protein